jgi:hypothetical protein
MKVCCVMECPPYFHLGRIWSRRDGCAPDRKMF